MCIINTTLLSLSCGTNRPVATSTKIIWCKGVVNSAECRPLPCALETSAHHRLCLVYWVSRQRGSREVCDNM